MSPVMFRVPGQWEDCVWYAMNRHAIEFSSLRVRDQRESSKQCGVSLFRLANVLDSPRGGRGGATTQIAPIPTPRASLSVSSSSEELQWPAGNIEKIIQSQWAPWPGYSVDPMLWSVVVESDGAGAIDKAAARPADRQVLYMRGHPIPSY